MLVVALGSWLSGCKALRLKTEARTSLMLPLLNISLISFEATSVSGLKPVNTQNLLPFLCLPLVKIAEYSILFSTYHNLIEWVEFLLSFTG